MNNFKATIKHNKDNNGNSNNNGCELTFDELIQHGVDVNIGLVRHDPASGQDFESPFSNQVFKFRLLIGRRLIPPHRQEVHLRPRKRHVFVNCLK